MPSTYLTSQYRCPYTVPTHTKSELGHVISTGHQYISKHKERRHLINVGTVRLVTPLKCSLMKLSFHAVEKLKVIMGGRLQREGKGREAVIVPTTRQLFQPSQLRHQIYELRSHLRCYSQQMTHEAVPHQALPNF